MYATTLTEAPSNFDFLQMYYSEKEVLLCVDCGCRFHADQAHSLFIHSSKVKRKPFQYDAKGNKIYHVEKCPVCKSHRLSNLKNVLQ